MNPMLYVEKEKGLQIFQRHGAWKSTGSVETGTALCYDSDYEPVVADFDVCRRRVYVEAPTAANHRRFAGVTLRQRAAIVNSVEQSIPFALPGSLVPVRCDLPTTNDKTVLCPTLATGRVGTFFYGGIRGVGAATAKQTVANATSATSAAAQPVSQSFTGTGSCTSAAVLTDTGKFTYAAVGDYVVVLGGARTSNGDSSVVTAGVYTILTKTSANEVVLATAPVSQTSLLTYYVVRGKPTVVVELLSNGPIAGACQFLSPTNGASAGTPLNGGTDFVCGGYTIAGNSTATLAAGGEEGILKVFRGLGALGTADMVVTVTAGKQMNGSSALASLAFDAADETAVLEHMGSVDGLGVGFWQLKGYAGAGLA